MKTTKAHFDLFRREVLRLLDLWGVAIDWHVEFRHDPSGEYRARCRMSLTNAAVDFVLSNDWEESPKRAMSPGTRWTRPSNAPSTA